MKTLTLVGYVAVAFACGYACGGSPGPSMSASTTDAGSDAEGNGGSGGNLTVTDARAGDGKEMDVASKDVASDGSDGGGAEDDAMETGTSSNTNSSQYCCMGGAFYLCPNAAALAQCGSACTHNPAYDAVCLSVDAGGGSSGGSPLPAPPAPPTNACGGSFIGVPSAAGGQCYGSDEHSMGNQCFPNDVGNPCTYPNDCGGANHCMNGCCQSPAKGSPCQAPWDCKSNMCSNNVCQ